MLADLARGFHFPPGELMAMPQADVLFWHGQLRELLKEETEALRRGSQSGA